MKTASELEAAKKPRIAPPLNAVPAVRIHSRLERLPAELIEQIFFHALEVNMAKASPFLMKTLSKESIYRTLILFAFFDDDEMYPVETKHFAPATYRVLSLEQKLQLQKGVLECPWCTLPRIKQCFPTFRRLAIFHSWHKERQIANEKVDTPVDSQQNVMQQQSLQPSRFPSFIEFYKTVNAHHCTCDFTTCIPCFSSCTFSVRYLPHRLLRPVSWHDSNSDNDKVRLLGLLLETFIFTEPPSNLTPDMSAVVCGLETAIRERHREALGLLLEIQSLSSDGTWQQQGEEGSIVHTASINPEQMLSLLHLATKQGEESLWILEMLVDDDRRTLVPKDDRVLMKWAIARFEEAPNEYGFAKWYLER